MADIVRDDGPMIVKVTALGLPVKTPQGFRAPVRYLLEDGREIDTGYTSNLKRDNGSGIAQLNAKAFAGDFRIRFYDSEDSWATSTRYHLRPMFEDAGESIERLRKAEELRDALKVSNERSN